MRIVKFSKDLGPTLDKHESAVKDKKPANVETYRKKAQETIKSYRKQVTDQKDSKDKTYCKLLILTLDKLIKELG